jgi:hypothetical protein
VSRVAAVVVLALAGRAAVQARPEAGSPVPVSASSPFLTCTDDQPSLQQGQLYLHSEVEPRLAVNPRNPDHVVGTFQQDRWSNGGARGIVTAVSLDGGLTWRTSVVPGVSRCSGGMLPRASDPWLSFAPNGDLYHLALALDGLDETVAMRSEGSLAPVDVQARPSETTSAMLVNKSTDGGLTWTPPATLVQEAGRLHDKGSITADPTDPAGRFVYAVWDRFSEAPTLTSPALFTRSTDAGLTWEPPRVIYDPGADRGTVGHQIVVLRDGTLVDVFAEWQALRDAGGSVRYQYTLSLLRSPDKGRSWLPSSRSQVVAPMSLRTVMHPRNRQPIRTGLQLPDVVADPWGHLFVVWQDASFHDGALSSIAFSMSGDGGATWSTPIRVNQGSVRGDPRVVPAFTPAVTVALDGTVAVTYYDLRNDDNGPGALVDYWLVQCLPTAARPCSDPSAWGREVRLTPTSFDIARAPYSRGYFVGDYQGLQTSWMDFMALFSQTDGADPASVFFRRISP